MSSDIAIKVENISKCYHIYGTPRDRLKQFIFPRIQSLIGLPGENYYQEFWALKNISFEIKKGETVGIVGRNGSGKSTLLQLICGTLNQTEGRIRTNGRIAALLELGSGFNPEFTGRENVYLNGAVLGLSKDEIDARYQDIIAFADIGDFIEQPVKMYSSGMLVRLAFAVAVNVDPQILIVDEALSVGDELFQRKCFSRIETIRATGATILFVSHSGAQVIELCDEAILLDDGEMISRGNPKRVITHYQRLLYAPAESKKEIRNQMLTQSENESAIIGVNEKDIIERFNNQKNDLETKEEIKLIEEILDPYLIPPSAVEFESHGPLIGKPEILTEEGKVVNGLIRGRRYRYRYQVVFNRAAEVVRFGMSIKTTTGISLAGSFSASGWEKAIQFVDKNTIINVEFLFYCHLNPGIYFMNAGVFGLSNGEECVLHRRADVIAFRVLPIQDNIETETVYLAFEPSVKIETRHV